jgi:thiol-disulfide isomerase/thioredoxin
LFIKTQEEFKLRKINILAFALFIFCFGIIVPGCSQSEGGAAPEISADAWLNTEPIKIADLTGKLIVVEFWATWCPPCRASIPHLKKMNDEYKDKGLVLISLTQEPMDKVEGFAKKAGMDWAVGTGSKSGSDYGVQGIPHAFIVKDGKIAWRGHPMSGLDEEVKKHIATLKPVENKEEVATEEEASAPATLEEEESEDSTSGEAVSEDDESASTPAALEEADSVEAVTEEAATEDEGSDEDNTADEDESN